VFGLKKAAAGREEDHQRGLAKGGDIDEVCLQTLFVTNLILIHHLKL
jgi:hypothetical protein